MTDEPRAIGDECSSCSTTGRRGYCAPGRCYCGHPTCHAYATWSPLPDLRTEPLDSPAPSTTAAPSSWDTREDSTWIDKL